GSVCFACLCRAVSLAVVLMVCTPALFCAEGMLEIGCGVQGCQGVVPSGRSTRKYTRFRRGGAWNARSGVVCCPSTEHTHTAPLFSMGESGSALEAFSVAVHTDPWYVGSPVQQNRGSTSFM
ncbi:unnamed protein product, partial [Scytosiphon promiscuus]